MRILAVEQSTHCSSDVILCLKKGRGERRGKGGYLSLLEWHWHDQLWSGHVLSTDSLLLAKIRAFRAQYFKSLTSSVLLWVSLLQFKVPHLGLLWNLSMLIVTIIREKCWGYVPLQQKWSKKKAPNKKTPKCSCLFSASLPFLHSQITSQMELMPTLWWNISCWICWDFKADFF